MNTLLKIFGLMILLNILCFAQSTWYVDITNGSDFYTGEHPTNIPMGTGPKQSIQAALDICSDDDIIVIAAGTYNECPMVTKIVTFQSRQLNANLEVIINLSTCDMTFNTSGQVVFERNDTTVLTVFRLIGSSTSGFHIISGTVLMNVGTVLVYPFLIW